MQAIIRMVAFGLSAAGLAGCATVNAGAPLDMAAGEPRAMVCNATPVQSYVGQRADQAAGATILNDSGARTLRWGPPNSAWTMDFREDRVNVQYDEQMSIVRISCG